MSPGVGMLKQMEWEQCAAKNLRIQWTSKMYCPLDSVEPCSITEFDGQVKRAGTGSFKSALNWIRLRRNYHRWLRINDVEFDVIIIRYYVHDPFQLWYALRCKKPLYFMCHTLAVDELGLGEGLRSFVRTNLERLIGRYCIQYADGILGISEQVVTHESARARSGKLLNHTYHNGILYGDTICTAMDKRSQRIPELLFVASFMPWQGLEELLFQIKDSDQNFILHVAGTRSDTTQLLLDQEKRVIDHGVVGHDEVKEIAGSCWIGLSNMELEKKNMTENSPLKVRQYLMYGLPVYGNKDVFPDSFPFYRVGGTNLTNILGFAQEMRSTSRLEVAERARKYIDKERILHELYSNLERDISSDSKFV